MSPGSIAAILSQLLVLPLLLWASPAFGEPLAGVMELRGTVGYSNFLDEGPLHHLVTGGSARFFVQTASPSSLNSFSCPGRVKTSTFISFRTWSSNSQSENRAFNHTDTEGGASTPPRADWNGILLVKQLDGLGREWD